MKQESTPLVRLTFLRNLALTLLTLGLAIFVVDFIAMYTYRNRIEVPDSAPEMHETQNGLDQSSDLLQ